MGSISQSFERNNNVYPYVFSSCETDQPTGEGGTTKYPIIVDIERNNHVGDGVRGKLGSETNLQSAGLNSLNPFPKFKFVFAILLIYMFPWVQLLSFSFSLISFRVSSFYVNPFSFLSFFPKSWLIFPLLIYPPAEIRKVLTVDLRRSAPSSRNKEDKLLIIQSKTGI